MDDQILIAQTVVVLGALAMNSRKRRIVVVALLVAVLVLLGTLLYMLLRKRHYNYKQINVAFMMTEHTDDDAQYVDIAHVYRKNLRRTTWFINMYNDELAEDGKPAEDALSLDEVIDFYSSEYDENGDARIDHLPTKIQNYLDWYYGFSRTGPRLEDSWAKEEDEITFAMFALGCYSERKNTQQISDVVINDPENFYTGIYVYNQRRPSEMITEDEVKMAMAGGPKEPLIRFGKWLLDPACAAQDYIEHFQRELSMTYVRSYLSEHPGAPEISEMDETEIQQLIAYHLETVEE